MPDLFLWKLSIQGGKVTKNVSVKAPQKGTTGAAMDGFRSLATDYADV